MLVYTTFSLIVLHYVQLILLSGLCFKKKMEQPLELPLYQRFTAIENLMIKSLRFQFK